MEQPFGLVVRFALKRGAGEAFDRLTSQTVEQIRAHEPGTLLYVVHCVEGQPDVRLFYERIGTGERSTTTRPSPIPAGSWPSAGGTWSASTSTSCR